MSTTASVDLPFFPPAHRDRILSHMNEDHADAVLSYARHFGGIADATAARLENLDRNGMDISVTLAGREQAIRVAYPAPLAAPSDAHDVLVDMAMKAAAASPPPRAGGDALARAREAVTLLRANFKTVILGTVSAAGEPDASVAAATLGDDGAFYVYVSALSAHTRNLNQTGKASVFLIEDESSARNLLARRRLTFPAAASLIERGSDAFTARMADLKARFGPVMEHLENMNDFQLIRLVPAKGRLVAGFGQAYDVDPLDWHNLGHVGDTGHTPAHASHKA